MARDLTKILKELPPARAGKIRKRAEELASLADLRRAAEKTQVDLAARLKVGQDTVSRIERQSDMLISTLRRYIEGIGGRLELVARFPDQRDIHIDRLVDGLGFPPVKRGKGAKSSRMTR